MATITGTYVKTGMSSSDRVNGIVDMMLSPQILEFRQISIFHERGTRLSSNVWKFSYQNWNEDYETQVFLNNDPLAIDSSLYSIDYNMGIITVSGDYTAGDNISCTYNFDYFPIYFLEGYVIKAVDIINASAQGAPTDYTIDDAPSIWDGIISDFMLAMCMEKLILDYDLWKGRLIFAIGPQSLAEGGGDVISSLETLKSNAEERAGKALDNDKFKVGAYLSKPTRYYYNALLVGSSARAKAGNIAYGKLRGYKMNKYLGRV